MEKSDSDLLEEWDVVTVSSVYETGKEDKEQENFDTKAKIVEIKNGSSNVEEDSIVATTETSSNVAPELLSDTAAKCETNVMTELKQNSEIETDIDNEPEPRLELNVELSDDIETVNNTITVKPESSIIDQIEITAEAESESESIEEPLSEKNVVDDLRLVTEINTDVDTEENADVTTEHITEAVKKTADNADTTDTVNDVNPTANDRSLTDFEIGSSRESYIQEVPEFLPKMTFEQEMASIESSSSDIDIIDENIEESITSSFISPLSLSISSSVADSSSIGSVTSHLDDINYHKTEQKKGKESYEKRKEKESDYFEKSHPEEKSDRHKKKSHRESQRTNNRRSLYDWCVLFIDFLRCMSGYEWCIIGTVAAAIYLTVIVNQTNIFAIVQKDGVMSQMKDMINELKHDNKILKEQMLSEMKNEKAMSYFEHQIKELRKENSKLNHMLYDVAKVIDKQQNFQEKKEAEYLAPFKKEINKLKEYINILKIDNEELQTQLVRMRYGSYSQGSKDTRESKTQARKEENLQAEEKASSAGEIPLDVESLKKWNDLISLLTEELGLLTSRAEDLKHKKSHSAQDSKPFWKVFLNDFKSSLNDFRKVNFSAVLSEYKKANQKAVSDVYKFVKDFFTAEEKSHQHTSGQDDPQWKNIADFVEDLKEKWVNIKDRLYTSDLKEFFKKHFKKSVEESFHPEHQAQKSTDEQAGKTTTNNQFDSHRKHDETQTETKWVFKRAEQREEERNSDDEEMNWYLKKGRHNSESKESRYL